MLLRLVRLRRGGVAPTRRAQLGDRDAGTGAKRFVLLMGSLRGTIFPNGFDTGLRFEKGIFLPMVADCRVYELMLLRLDRNEIIQIWLDGNSQKGGTV
jgi:hypothetical protein